MEIRLASGRKIRLEEFRPENWTGPHLLSVGGRHSLADCSIISWRPLPASPALLGGRTALSQAGLGEVRDSGPWPTPRDRVGSPMEKHFRARRRQDEAKSKAVARCRLRKSGALPEQITPRRVGKLARSPALCSCWRCANRRKDAGKTVQERRAEQGVQ